MVHHVFRDLVEADPYGSLGERIRLACLRQSVCEAGRDARVVRRPREVLTRPESSCRPSAEWLLRLDYPLSERPDQIHPQDVVANRSGPGGCHRAALAEKAQIHSSLECGHEKGDGGWTHGSQAAQVEVQPRRGVQGEERLEVCHKALQSGERVSARKFDLQHVFVDHAASISSASATPGVPSARS